MAGNPGALVLRREDDGEVLCERCVVADTTFRRLRGLLGRRDLRPGEGIVLRPGWSIHTAFLLFSIDVAFADERGRVLRVIPDLPPRRIRRCPGAAVALEAHAGELSRFLRWPIPRAGPA